MDLLGVFAKHWTAGQVKTRLAATIGPRAAAALYRACVDCTLERFAAAGDQRWLAYWPPEARRAFAPWEAVGWRLTPQAAGDLGQRMQQFFTQALAAGAQRVVLIGSDSPTLPVAHVARAFHALTECAAVLAPAADGGYCLVGAAGQVPPIFEGIAWSTGDVWPQTLARLAASQTTFAVLPEWYDVDEVRDLHRLHDELASMTAPNAAWRSLQEAVVQALGE